MNKDDSPSEVPAIESKTTKMGSHETVKFVDGDMPWLYDVCHSEDETTKLAGFTDAELGDFLSRPILIERFSWAPGGTLVTTEFNPWERFFSNPDVVEKINRFRNLRCNLRLKVLINGNSFYYGRLLMSYNPYTRNDSVTLNRPFFEQDLVQATQKPHILIDPTSSQGGEMLLPFIWPENFHDITNAGWYDDMGVITFRDFDILRHANGGDDPIDISIYAWTENLVLSVPTSSQAQSGIADRPLDKFGFPVRYEPQAGGSSNKSGRSMKRGSNQSSNDEFKRDGLISKPASAIAAAANALSMVPMLMPYAKATSMVATKIGQVAKIFGYSRPPVLEDTNVYVPRYVGNMANSDAPEPLTKLTLDSKNELTIDSRVVGLGGHDELSIMSIAKRPSFWHQFTWPEGFSADSPLMSCVVQPMCIRQLRTTFRQEIHPTALAFATAPFECWQGTIKFRFVVVASEYHRGRLRIVYNPRDAPGLSPPFNQTYSTIIDISEDRDFEYEVKWADVRAWASVLTYENAAAAEEAQTLFQQAGASGGQPFDNGTLSVYVVNELATPSSTVSDVKVQVWVSAGDDFAVSVPTTTNISRTSYFQLQSEIAPEVMATTIDSSNAPMNSTLVPSFGDGAEIKEDNQYLVYQGERIVSFRDFLHRYQYHYSYNPSAAGGILGHRKVTFNMSDFPFYRGWDPNGVDTANANGGPPQPYTYCTQTLLNYLTPAFVCRRGCIRHKAMISTINAGSNNNNQKVPFSVSRHDLTSTNTIGYEVYPLGQSETDNRYQLQRGLGPTLGGMHVTAVHQNPVLEYETPFYTVGQRFVPARDTNFFGTNVQCHNLATEVCGLAEDLQYRVDTYVSIGEDFSLGFFVGAPVLWNYDDPQPSGP